MLPREAVRMLAGESLVERMPARGAIVRRLAYFKLNRAIQTVIVALPGHATLAWAHEATLTECAALSERVRRSRGSPSTAPLA